MKHGECSMIIRSWIGSLWSTWEEFWFAPIDPLPLALFRICLGLNLLVMYGLRHFDLATHYTDAAVIGSANALSVLPESYRPAIELFRLITPHPFLWHWIFLASLVLITMGIGGRISAFIALLLHLAFMQRNVSVVYGADIVTSFFLFSLVLSGGSQALNIFTWLRARQGVSAESGRDASVSGSCSLFGRFKYKQKWFFDALTTTGVRLLQIQLCVIYAYTGWEKLKGATWWDGSALWSVMGNSQLMLVDLSWLKDFPIVIGVMTHTALLFEIYFPVLVWMKPLRKWVLLYGCLMHVGIAVLMGLFFFSGAMLSAYWVFVDADAIRRFQMKFSRRQC